MLCQEIQEQLMEYLDEDLDHEKDSLIQTHLAHCATCTKRAEEIKQLSSVMSKIDIPPESPFFEAMRQNVFEKIRKHSPSKQIVFDPTPPRRWMPVLIPVTAALVLFIGIRVIPPRYQEYAMKRDLADLALIQENEKPGFVEVHSNEKEALEEELTLTDEQPLVLAEAKNTDSSDGWIQEEIDVLNALGEGDALDENGGAEELEKEVSSFDEEAVG